MATSTLAVDFGTSNTAAAFLVQGAPNRLAIEGDADTLPTAVFLPSDGGTMFIGNAATNALITGEDGRYMRAFKSVLGTELFHEPRLIAGRRRTLAEIATAFLVTLKARAEAESGQSFSHILSGRPVHFHSSDFERDALAEADLRACYQAAGFDEVQFLFEPEAAALASLGLSRAGETGMIVDIGGGTSDFTVFRAEGGRPHILASHGIRLGGTDFDHAISMTHAMPLLGHGGQLRRSFGSGLLPVPNAIYADLATWAKIPFLYTPEVRRAAVDLLRHSVEPRSFARLVKVLERQLGHELAFAVEAGKITANVDETASWIDMGFIETALSAPISAGSLSRALERFRADLREAMLETLSLSGTPPVAVNSIILVGGSSLMSMIGTEARTVCPNADLHRSDAFTAVVDGLALATGL